MNAPNGLASPAREQAHMPVLPRPERIDSVDVLRGLVIVIMALDHVRDYFSDRFWQDPTDLKTTFPALFFTRWITHLCAPTFIFLAGTGAFLAGTRGKSKADLSWFLFTRGLWFAVFEITWNRAAWMFNYDWYNYGAGVFWPIGWSMVVLSVLVYLPTSAIATFGVVMIAFHNLLDGISAEAMRLPNWIWVILHSGGQADVLQRMTLDSTGKPVVAWSVTFGTGYCLIPWVGVMAAGYGFGSILLLERRVRRRELFGLGAALTVAFAFLRWANVYGDSVPWSRQTSDLFTVLSFLNCSKYPPSLLYLLMTLGPAILLLALFDRPVSPLLKPILIFGRVPFFFYILHIPLIHGAAVLLDYQRFGWSPLGHAGPWDVDPKTLPDGYGLSLPWVYAVWVTLLLVLYLPCHWFAGVKRRHRSAWLSYF